MSFRSVIASPRRSATCKSIARRRSPRFEPLEHRRVPASFLSVGLGAASDPDANGIVVRPRVQIVGVADPGATIAVDRDADGSVDRLVHADIQGRFALAVKVSPGATTFHVKADGGSSQSLVVRRGDAALNWNATLLDTIRRRGTPPPRAAYNLGSVHVAMLEALRAVDRRFAAAGAAGQGSRWEAWASAATSQAALSVASGLYPADLARFQATHRENVSSTGEPRRALRLGSSVGQARLDAQADDGSNEPVAYTPSTEPGLWRPTPPANAPGLLPHWGNVRPLAVANPNRYQVAGFPSLDSVEYAAQVRQVASLGAARGSSRTDDQTQIALFWADGAGTFTPPGHWNQIATEAALDAANGLSRNVRILAALNAALCDAGILCWDAKYAENVWRPITAIRLADQDGNADTTAIPDWTPLIVTPPFPSYVSGHSTFSGAAATVLTAFYGSSHAFSDVGDPIAAAPPRSFESFQQAADEAGMSRIYGGIHYMSDNLDGLKLGRDLAREVLARLRANRGPA